MKEKMFRDVTVQYISEQPVAFREKLGTPKLHGIHLLCPLASYLYLCPHLNYPSNLLVVCCHKQKVDPQQTIHQLAGKQMTGIMLVSFCVSENAGAGCQTNRDYQRL